MFLSPNFHPLSVEIRKHVARHQFLQFYKVSLNFTGSPQENQETRRTSPVF